jgi:hypothetical protein
VTPPARKYVLDTQLFIQGFRDRAANDALQQLHPGTYNDFWFERGSLNNRTSLVIDPPNGRIPPLTPGAQKRAADARSGRGPADSPEDRSAFERCITRSLPGAMMPGFYNHNYQVVQTPGYVVIHVEMIHDARIIPVDGRPHVGSPIRNWMGDSRGRWEGNTLVVETTSFNDKVREQSLRVPRGQLRAGWHSPRRPHGRSTRRGRQKELKSMLRETRDLIGHVDQSIALTHVLIEKPEERPGYGPWPAVANYLPVPLDDRRHFHRAAEEQHLAGSARVGHRDVADLDALQESLIP